MKLLHRSFLPLAIITIATTVISVVGQTNCGTNESFNECGTACPKKCDEPPAEVCTQQCVQGCFCNAGFCLDENDNCVSECRNENGNKEKIIDKVVKRLRLRLPSP